MPLRAEERHQAADQRDRQQPPSSQQIEDLFYHVIVSRNRSKNRKPRRKIAGGFDDGAKQPLGG
jgi:hypothetical protein